MSMRWHLGAALAAGLLMTACGGERIDLTAQLTGNGSATADVRIESGSGRICWELSDFVGRIDGEVTGIHIHAGSRGNVGPVVVPSLSGGSACTEVGASAVTPTTLQDIVRSPDAFYVDVHTSQHPDGAVRGQLRLVSS